MWIYKKVVLLLLGTLVANMAIASSVTGSATPCEGEIKQYSYDGPLKYTYNSNTYNSTITWSIDNGAGYFTDANGSSNNGTYLQTSDGTTGSMYVKWTVGSNAGNASNVVVSNSQSGQSNYNATLSINVYSMSLSISPSTISIASGQSATLQATSGYTGYSWSCNNANCHFTSGTSAYSVTVAPTVNTIYTVQASGQICGTKTASATVSVNALTCPASLNLTGPIINTEYKTSGTLSASNVTISGPSSVLFRGQKVVLNPSFKGKAISGKFKAQVNPCLAGTRVENFELDDATSIPIINKSNPYPNPISSGILYFGKTANNYSLIDSKGVPAGGGSNADKLDISQLSKGLYLLNIDGESSKIAIE